METEQEKMETLDKEPLISTNNIQEPRSLLWRIVRTFFIILPIVTVGAFSNSPHSTVTNQLIYNLFGGTTKGLGHGNSNTSSNQSTCTSSVNKSKEDAIQVEVSNFRLYMHLGSLLAAIVFVPFWGALSDHLGRYIIVFAAGFGAIVRDISVLILSVNESAPKWILILGETLHGCFGKSSSGMIMACAAIVSDELPLGKRTFMMIAVDFLFLMTETASQFCTGYWIKHSGYTPILITGLAGHVTVVLYSLVLMPRLQSFRHDVRYSQATLRQKIKLYIVSPYKTYLAPRSDYTRLCLLLLVLLLFLRYIGEYGVTFLLTTFALGPPLCWNSVILGIFDGVRVGLSGLVPMLFGLTVLKRKPSCWLILLGLLGGVVSSIVYGFAVTNVMMFTAVTILSPMILVSAVSRSFLADLTEETEHGAVMSGYVLVSVVAELLSLTTFNTIYQTTIASCSQCFFLFSAGFYGLAVFVLGIFAFTNRENNKLHQRENELTDPVT